MLTFVLFLATEIISDSSFYLKNPLKVLASRIKLVMKEDILPVTAGPLFTIRPYIVFTASFLAFYLRETFPPVLCASLAAFVMPEMIPVILLFFTKFPFWFPLVLLYISQPTRRLEYSGVKYALVIASENISRFLMLYISLRHFLNLEPLISFLSPFPLLALRGRFFFPREFLIPIAVLSFLIDLAARLAI